MDLDAALTHLKAATASVVGALRESEMSGLSRSDLVSIVESVHRSSNSLAGVQTVAVAHLAAIEDHVDVHGAFAEQHRGLGHVSLDAPGLVAPVVGISAQASSSLVDLAVHQVSRTPRLVEAMLAGDLDPWRARVVTTEVEIIPEETTFGAEAVVDDLIEHYRGRGRGWHETTGPLRARVRRMVARAHPDLVEKEAAEAREGRSVRRHPATMGTDHWEADLPVEVSLPMWQAVEALAQQLKSADPELTIGQARADALAQLVLQQADVTIHLHGTVPEHAADDPAEPNTSNPNSSEFNSSEANGCEPSDTRHSGAGPHGIGPDGSTRAETVAFRSSMSSSAGRAVATGHPMPSDRLTEVGGLGSTQPTLLDLLRLASAPGVRVVGSTPLTCHPGTGALTGGIVPASLARLVRKDAARRSDGYVVPADMARLVRLRDGRCRFPNCQIPASKTDQDHVIPWPVGATTPTNLMCLCRRHHRVKQRRGWSVRLAVDGLVHWCDPAGGRTTTFPVDHLDRLGDPAVPATPDGSLAGAPPLATATGAGTLTDVGATFNEIVRTHLADLDALATPGEDHVWRQLELAHPGSTHGGVTPASRHSGEGGFTWGRSVEPFVCELIGLRGHPEAEPPSSDDPPF